MSEKRFQDCNKIVQIWRYRWYLLIPFQYIWFMYVKPFVVKETEMDDDKGHIVDTGEVYNPRGKDLWRLLIGMAQGEMKWYYTSEEVFGKLGLNDEDNIS